MSAAGEVAAVVPARNAAATLRACLEALAPLAGRELTELVVVDDGSTDATARIARSFGARVVRESGRGPGAARNAGWRSVAAPWVWFVDADCVARSDALALLQAAAEEAVPRAGAPADAAPDALVGVGGSYENLRPDSRVACWIHEEIALRHAAMPREVDFLATFNVLYRREALEKVGGFDERFLKAQDAELAFRLRRAGGRLRFERRSRVGHFHDTRLRSYLATQRAQGYWRVWLYFSHPERMSGDSYSGVLDHLQPPLAAAALGALPLLAVPGLRAAPLLLELALLAAALPMAWRMRPSLGWWRGLGFAPFAALRAHARAIGMTQAVLHAALHTLRARFLRRRARVPRSRR